MEDMIPCPMADRDVFQRVWQRVMAGRPEGDSPIATVPMDWHGDLSCECLNALAQQEGAGTPPECQRELAEQSRSQAPAVREMTPLEPAVMEEELPMEPEPSVREPMDMTSGWQPAEETPAPEPTAPEGPCEQEAEDQGLPERDGPHRGSDLPRQWEEPQPSGDRTARLRRQVMEALEGWQFYRHLAKRARGTDQRMLNAMAGELHKHARKLAAAYFLLTGLRYWPTELLGAPAIPSYWGALRTRHQAEQRQENAYRLSADDWEEPDMLELYAELIEGCQRRSHQLRSLLEQGDT